MLDFRIETFLTVCKYLNYTKAAKELNITQPGVSQHIKYLEEYYGDKLFGYSNKKLTLTQAGLELRDTMISIKHDNVHLQNRIQQRVENKNIIKFGATLTIGDFWLPSKISEYMKRNSNSQVGITIANTKELLTLLEEGEIEFALVEGYFRKSEYEYRTISNEKFILACGKDYPLDQVKDIKELLGHNLFLREDGSGSKEILERYLLGHGYTFSDFSSTSVISSIHAIKHFLEKGHGISFVYEVAVKKELDEGKLKIITMANFDVYHEFNYIWRKNSSFCEYYQTLYSTLFDMDF